MFRHFLRASLLFFTLPALAVDAPADVVVQELSSFDTKFFRAMKKHEAIFKQSGVVESRGEITFLNAVDQAADGKNILMFHKPLDGKVQLLGYFDEIVDLGQMGSYYSWGVLAKGKPDAVAAAIQPLILDGAPLRKEGDVHVRLEVRDVTQANGAWMNNDTIGVGAIPKHNAVERVFLVEAGDKPGTTRITCSLHGNIGPLLVS
jgi:hypothetical protein